MLAIRSSIAVFRRSFIITLTTAILSALSYTLALFLRFEFDMSEITPIHRLNIPIYLLICMRLLSFYCFGVFHHSWQHISVRQATHIALALALSSLGLAAAVLMLRVPEFPRSVLFIEFCIACLMFAAVRLGLRVVFERSPASSRQGAAGTPQPVIVLGAGNSGHLLIKMIQNHLRSFYQPVSVLDDSESKMSSTVYGVPVRGTLSDLKRTLEKYPQVSLVLIAIPSLSQNKLRQIWNVCGEMGVAVKRQTSIEDLILQDSSATEHDFSPEVLLERATDLEHEGVVRDWLHEKTILITGAGGSIGSEIVRQLCSLDPKTLIFVDMSEENLFRLKLEIDSFFPEINTRYVIANLRDFERLDRIFSEAKPHLVFHAAAYKHVPLMENNPYEAFQTNIVGTLHLLEICESHSCEQLVLISSDKAVNPVGVMGSTKRVAELLVQAFSDNKSTLRTCAVRFGNVINSSGSVIPVFKEQILSGGPITVTHKDVERYFMSTQEAVRLVLAASTLGSSGEIFALDLGKKVKILELAKRLRSLYGRGDVEIVFTGLRPGERLTEDLSSHDESRASTSLQSVSKIEHPKQVSRTEILPEIAQLRETVSSLSSEKLVSRISSLCMIGQSPNKID